MLLNNRLLLACHALALGLDNDDIVSTALLHEVCEGCGIMPEELPVNDTVKTAVLLLTKEVGAQHDEAEYYNRILQNEVATVVKLLDRCNNVSGMSTGFTKEKMVEYVNETEKWYYPLLQKAKTDYPQYSNQIFLIKYHMTSVILTMKHLLNA